MGEFVVSSAAHTVTVAKKSQIQVRSPVVEIDHVNWLVIKWLILSPLHTSTLGDKGLTDAFKFLNPSADLWPVDKSEFVERIFCNGNLKLGVSNVTNRSILCILWMLDFKTDIYLTFFELNEQILSINELFRT